MYSMLTIPRTDDERQAKRADFLARWERLGWSQNGAADRAGLDQGWTSRVLRGETKARIVWTKLERVTGRAERRRRAARRVSA